MINVLRKNRETIPFTMSNIKYLGVTLTKQVKDLYNKNFNCLKKEVEEDLKKWKDLPRSWISTIKMTNLPKAIYRFNAIPIKITTELFKDIQRTFVKLTWKEKKTQDRKKEILMIK